MSRVSDSVVRRSGPHSAAQPVLGVRPVRRWVLWLHLGVGLGLGLLLVVVALSGSLIVFRAEIEDALHASMTRVFPGGSRAPADSRPGASSASRGDVPHHQLTHISRPIGFVLGS